MAKSEQSYSKDDIVHHINLWFETHENLSNDNYKMLCSMVHYMRNDSRMKAQGRARAKK